MDFPSVKLPPCISFQNQKHRNKVNPLHSVNVFAVKIDLLLPILYLSHVILKMRKIQIDCSGIRCIESLMENVVFSTEKSLHLHSSSLDPISSVSSKPTTSLAVHEQSVYFGESCDIFNWDTRTASPTRLIGTAPSSAFVVIVLSLSTCRRVICCDERVFVRQSRFAAILLHLFLHPHFHLHVLPLGVTHEPISICVSDKVMAFGSAKGKFDAQVCLAFDSHLRY